MELPVINSHLMGSTGLYGTSIGAPGIPLAMGIQISEQNGVHILKKPPIPPINVVKGSANPIVQANNVRQRRKIFPQLQAQMGGMGGMMPQSLIGNQTMLPGVMGTTVMPPIPMVSQMGMPSGPAFINHSNNFMPGMLPPNTMAMTGASMGMGPGPALPINNSQAINMTAAMGLALLQGPQRGSFPQQPPMMMQDDYHMPFDKEYQDHYDPFANPNQMRNSQMRNSQMRNSQFRNSQMRNSNDMNQQMNNQTPGFGQHDQYNQFHENNIHQPPQGSHVIHSQHNEHQPIVINQPPQQPPVVIIQQPPVAPPPAQNNTSLIDKIGLITGMVMAQKNSGRSQQIQNLEMAQLNQIKQDQQMTKTMMRDIQMQRSAFQQDRTMFRQSQMYGNPTMVLRQSTTYPINMDNNMNFSRTSLATNEQEIRVVIFPKCKPQIFSTKNPVL